MSSSWQDYIQGEFSFDSTFEPNMFDSLSQVLFEAALQEIRPNASLAMKTFDGKGYGLVVEPLAYADLIRFKVYLQGIGYAVHVREHRDRKGTWAVALIRPNSSTG